MKISERKVGDVLILDCFGSMSPVVETTDITDAIWKNTRKSVNKFLINLAGVSSIDNDTAMVISRLQISLVNQSRQLKLLNPKPSFYQLFKNTGMISTVEIFEDEQTALTSFANTKNSSGPRHDTVPTFSLLQQFDGGACGVLCTDSGGTVGGKITQVEERGEDLVHIHIQYPMERIGMAQSTIALRLSHCVYDNLRGRLSILDNRQKRCITLSHRQLFA